MKNTTSKADKRVGTCAIDQFGNTYHNREPHPRKALLERLGRSRATKMYVDMLAGETRHVGYVIAGHWLTLYNLSQWSSSREVTT